MLTRFPLGWRVADTDRRPGEYRVHAGTNAELEIHIGGDATGDATGSLHVYARFGDAAYDRPLTFDHHREFPVEIGPERIGDKLVSTFLPLYYTAAAEAWTQYYENRSADAFRRAEMNALVKAFDAKRSGGQPDRASCIINGQAATLDVGLYPFVRITMTVSVEFAEQIAELNRTGAVPQHEMNTDETKDNEDDPSDTE